MRGLAILLAEADGPRAALVLELAASEAALGGPVALFLSRAALALLAEGGAPLRTFRELGGSVCVCQTSMAAAGLDASSLPDWAEPSGLVGFLGARRDWRLLAG